MWVPQSVPELGVAVYSARLLASLQAYGLKRTTDYGRLRKCGARRGGLAMTWCNCSSLSPIELARADPTSRLPGFEQMLRRAAA